MEVYKKDVLKGFEKRRYELIEIQNGNDLPWWLEEKWMLDGLKHNGSNDKLYISFLTDKQWENGPKLVDEVLVSTAELSSYSDLSSTILKLDMRKGIFNEKLRNFWAEFDSI